MERINPKYFGIMETINEPTQINQRILPDDTNVWQILSKWEHQRQQLQRQQHKLGEQFSHIFMVKIGFAYNYSKNDRISTALYFSQTYFDLL